MILALTRMRLGHKQKYGRSGGVLRPLWSAEFLFEKRDCPGPGQVGCRLVVAGR